MLTKLPLENAAALIVGAGQGIGRSCALALATDGADVALAARRAEPLDALAAAVTEATGRRTLAVVTDIADTSQCRAAVEATVSEFGRIDVVVNIATYGGGSVSVADLDWDDYLQAVQINVIGTMEICRSAAARMALTGGGSIINISALSATTLMTGLSRYTSTKGAMESMSAADRWLVERSSQMATSPGFHRQRQWKRASSTCRMSILRSASLSRSVSSLIRRMNRPPRNSTSLPDSGWSRTRGG